MAKLSDRDETYEQCLQNMAWDVIQGITKGENLLHIMSRLHRRVQVWEQDRIASQKKPRHD